MVIASKVAKGGMIYISDAREGQGSVTGSGATRSRGTTKTLKVIFLLLTFLVLSNAALA